MDGALAGLGILVLLLFGLRSMASQSGKGWLGTGSVDTFLDLTWKIFWGIFIIPWRATVWLLRGTWRSAADLLEWIRSQRRILGPGAPLALPAGDYLDYRGVAEQSELGVLSQGELRLGRYLDPNGARGRGLWLPVNQLHRNSVVIGPSGAGKTESIIIPWVVALIRAGCSVVTVDVRGDLMLKLSTAIGPLSVRQWYWNSGDIQRSKSWNWISSIQDQRDIESAVQSILGRKRLNDPQPYFYLRDCRWLRALIQVTKQAYGQRAKPADLCRLVSDQDALKDVFKRVPAVRGLTAELNDLLQFPLAEHSRAVSGLQNDLLLFKLPNVVQVTERSDFDLGDISARPTLLVIGALLADARVSEVLSSIMINQVMNLVFRRFTVASQSSTRPLFFILDEAPRLRERINYEETLSIVRGAAAGVCLAAQDVCQFGDEREAATILANCQTTIVLPGSSPQTARYLMGRLGHRQQQKITINKSKTRSGDSETQTVQTESVPVLAEREIMRPPHGLRTGVVHVQEASPKPFLVDLQL